MKRFGQETSLCGMDAAWRERALASLALFALATGALGAEPGSASELTEAEREEPVQASAQAA